MSPLAASSQRSTSPYPAAVPAAIAAPTFLLPRRTRPQVEALVTFVATASAVARDPAVAAEQRLARLTAWDAVLAGERPAGDDDVYGTLGVLAAAETPSEPLRLLLQGAAKDVRTTRMRRWSELLSYCRFAAAPAGRFLVELHGEDRSLVPAAEALAVAIRLTAVASDCGTDYASGGRIYLPADWMREAGCGEADLAASRASPALRTVLARLDDRVRHLMGEARPGLAAIADPGLRRFAVSVAALAELQARAIARRDPLRRLVRPSIAGYWLCVGRAVAGDVLRRRTRR
jgi:phytoene/squalene synthetase